MKEFFRSLSLIAMVCLLAGCQASADLNQEFMEEGISKPIQMKETAEPVFTPTATIKTLESPTPTQKQIEASATASKQLVATQSLTPTQTPTRQMNFVWHEAEQAVEAPILLYHHVMGENDNQYYLSIEEFEKQMDWIVMEGYVTITASQLTKAITTGGYLPEKPILITFDDGHRDLFENAYPVLKKRGMVATAYLIGICIDVEECMNTEQINILVESGWEIGSHSMTHKRLTNVENLNFEMYQSRVYLEDKLGVEVRTFAYPYGDGNEFIFRKAWQYGFDAAMGLGKRIVHYPWTLFYLSRITVRNGMSVDQIAELIIPTPTPLIE